MNVLQTPNNWNLLQVLSSLKTNWLAEGFDVPNVEANCWKEDIKYCGISSTPHLTYCISPSKTCISHVLSISDTWLNGSVQASVCRLVPDMLGVAFRKKLKITSAGMRSGKNIKIICGCGFFLTASSGILEKLFF